jgi:CBS domain containing-hemolysin-like protein
MQEVAAQSAAAVAVLVALTGLQMVFGELVPKSLALQFPTQVARLTVVPMQWSLRLLRGFIVVLNGSGAALLRLVGAGDVGHRHIHSPDEIEYLIVESREGGQLAPAESARLRQALQLSVRSAGELMVPRTRIEALDAATPADELLQAVRDTPYTRLPVYEDTIDHIVGILHVRDVAVRLVGDGVLPAADLRPLLRPVLIVPETLTADRLLSRMRAEKRTMAVVADEYGGTAGLVTIDDILDELLGEVGDEFRTAGPVPERLADGTVRLPGMLRLDEAAPWVGATWAGDAYTVAGHVIEAFGRIPAEGDAVAIDGARVVVERVRRHAVDSVLVTPAPRDAAGDEGEAGGEGDAGGDAGDAGERR